MSKNGKVVLGLAVAVFLGVVAYAALTAPDERSANEHIGDAISDLDEGVDDAARELEKRTPAERISDEWRDSTDGDPQ